MLTPKLFDVIFVSLIYLWQSHAQIIRKTISVMVCEKKNRSLMFSVDRKPRVHRSSGNLGNHRLPLERWALWLGFFRPMMDSTLNECYNFPPYILAAPYILTRVHRSSGKLGKPPIPLERWTLGLGFSCLTEHQLCSLFVSRRQTCGINFAVGESRSFVSVYGRVLLVSLERNFNIPQQ